MLTPSQRLELAAALRQLTPWRLTAVTAYWALLFLRGKARAWVRTLKNPIY